MHGMRPRAVCRVYVAPGVAAEGVSERALAARRSALGPHGYGGADDAGVLAQYLARAQRPQRENAAAEARDKARGAESAGSAAGCGEAAAPHRPCAGDSRVSTASRSAQPRSGHSASSAARSEGVAARRSDENEAGARAGCVLQARTPTQHCRAAAAARIGSAARSRPRQQREHEEGLARPKSAAPLRFAAPAVSRCRQRRRMTPGPTCAWWCFTCAACTWTWAARGTRTRCFAQTCSS